MAKFTFTRNWSGYSRGRDTVTVEADTLEEAKWAAEVAYEYDSETVRDDRHREEWELDE